VKQFAPIPLVQAGGIQPYHGSTPQMPGDALQAMMRGMTFGGQHPMNASRALQSGPTLLSLLSSGGSQTPGTPGGAYQLTPDQHDRNREHSEDEMRGWQSGSEERRAAGRARNRRLPARPNSRGHYS
jgi:hypothetical protein